MTKNIFITGGGRGIGQGLALSLCKKHRVIIGVRKSADGQKVLKAAGNIPSISYVIADVSDCGSLQKAAEELKSQVGHIDVLVNNAGVLDNYDKPALKEDPEVFMRTFDINVAGVLRVCQKIVPLMGKGGRIINISSLMGQLSGMGGGASAYRVSKTALNALTKILSLELSGQGIDVCAVSPGWVQTDMGGKNAALTVEQSIVGLAATVLAPDFPNGKFLQHGKQMEW